MDYTPLIGITVGSGENLPNRPELYVSWLKKAGGIAEFIYPGSGKKGITAHFDGFLIPGGKDISPLHYGQEQRHEIISEEDGRTEFELLLLRRARAKRKPVLGICYGMQLMNVFCRGTLYQDIQSERQGTFDHRQSTHRIDVLQNPYLECGSSEVSSSHHQAVKQPGKGLIPFALSQDGIIEALYHPSDPFFVGVQWHPERTDNGLSASLSRVFVEACRVRE